MGKQILNNLESANIFRTKANANFTELYDQKAIVNHSSNSNIYGVSSASMYGHIKVTASNGLAINDGVLTLGLATTSIAGAVILVDNATTADSTKAATANALKGVADSAVKTYYGTDVPTNDIGKNGDIYFKIV